MSDISNTIIKPVVVVLITALILGGVSLYNDVQANSSHRINAEVEQYSQKELLMKLNTNLLVMSQDVKYLRKEVDALAESQKTIAKEVSDSRMMQIQPWKYQSKSE